jgi:7,8-dihydroneopterin aldolase/epimerase/oxygenase
MGIIEIEGMEFYAYHGCFKEEQIVGNKFLVDLTLEVLCSKAGKTDMIGDAVNYQVAYNIVKAEMEIKSHLLEHVCTRILESLFKHLPNIKMAKVKVAKVNPPLGGKTQQVSVALLKYNTDIQSDT